MTEKRKAQDDKASETAPDAKDAPVERLDETVPGGKYLAADGKTFVDANGNPVKGKA